MINVGDMVRITNAKATYIKSNFDGAVVTIIHKTTKNLYFSSKDLYPEEEESRMYQLREEHCRKLTPLEKALL